MLDSVRLGKKAKTQLATLKRKTGIENWNILCRWAFAISIVEPTRARPINDPMDDGIEMAWRTFAGEYSSVYEGLLYLNCLDAGIEPTPSNLAQQIRCHISRGIGYLAAAKEIRTIPDLVKLASSQGHSS